MSDNLLVLSEVKKTLRTPFSRKPGFPVGPLNLTIGPAEIVGLIGANGAGKTTTIKLILGLLVPEAGRVELVGTPSTSNGWRSQVGYLPEQPAFYDYLSGLEFMRFVGELFDLRGEALSLKVNQLLDRVGLSDSRHRPIRTYSKGMLQRLGIAQALLNDPRLLIMDEPMSGLDPLGRRFVRDLLLELRAEGRSILFSTHIIPDAEYVCDRVALMRGGQLVSVGTFDELLGLPTEFEVASVFAAQAGLAQRFSVTVKPAALTATIGDIVSRGGQLVSVSPVRTAVEDLLALRPGEGTETMASHFRRLWAVAYNTYLESVRQRLFIGLLFFAFLLLTTSLILKDVSVRQDLKILQDIGLAATEFFGTLIAIFLGADLIGRDIERRTLHLLVVKPLTRAEFLVGRYLGLCLTLLTSVVLMASGLAMALLTAQGSFTWALALATFAIYLQLCLTGAIATFLSATASRALALLGATVLCVLGRLTDVLKNASLILEGFPDWLGKGLYLALPNLLNFDLKTRAIYGDPIPPGLIIDLVAYAAAYTVVLLSVATLTFQRRDLK